MIKLINGNCLNTLQDMISTNQKVNVIIYSLPYNNDKYCYITIVGYIMKLNCKMCNNIFKSRNKKQKFCSCKCYTKYVIENIDRKKLLNDFINKSIIIHKNKYDYSHSEYINSNTKIKIICPIHGEFLQTPGKHLRGHGCPKCAKSGIKYSKEELIKKFNLIHKNKYDYSKIEYVNSHSKIKIICPIHGEFLQVPYSHIQGHGCPMCKESNGEIIINEFLMENNLILDKDYFREYKFDNCKDVFTLPFDFYIKEKNICIEFQGKQHYTTDFWKYMKNISYSPLERLQYIQKHDEIKKQYCKDNNINLIIIDSRMFTIKNKIDKELLKKYLMEKIFND